MPKFNMDMHPDNDDVPQPGDLVVGLTKAYRVTNARHVDSRQWSNRWALRLDALGWIGWADPHFDPHGSVDMKDGTVVRPEEGGRIHYTSRYAKGETPVDYFGPDH